MRLITKVDAADFQGKVYETMLNHRPTYQYKVFLKNGKKNVCVDRSCVYFHDKEVCYQKMKDSLDMLLGMKDTLLTMKF